MTEKPDRHVIACNYVGDVASISNGSKAYVTLLNTGSGHLRVMVIIRTRSGRWVHKWESIKRLDNFRVKTLPKEHFFYADERIIDGKGWGKYETLDELVEILEGARARATGEAA